MTEAQVCEACAPSATFKRHGTSQKRGEKHSYRGYKGVGMTFLAYGTDDISIHSRTNGTLVKGRMRSGRQWAEGKKDEAPLLEPDDTKTLLDSRIKRGTWVQVRFSQHTKPVSLAHLGTSIEMWETIIRTRTAAGQVLIDRDPVMPIKITLYVIKTDGEKQSKDIPPTFYYPHEVPRNPDFRFLDIGKYYADHPGVADVPQQYRRQDGVYRYWTTAEVEKLLGDRFSEHAETVAAVKPVVYGFRPYHARIYGELNQEATKQTRAHFFDSGLVIAVNRQRMADVFTVKASRWELLATSLFVLVHFDNAKPDQGRKTLQTNIMDLAQAVADSAVQLLLRQSTFLKSGGEKTTSAQREAELTHQDWIENVKYNLNTNPLDIPPVSYRSGPIAEQDIVGLFNQLSALDVFPGLRIMATSTIHIYDCLVNYDCKNDLDKLRYRGLTAKGGPNLLGLASDVFALDEKRFRTKDLTLEFKNSLEGLIHDLEDPQKRKTFSKVDICVCWASIDKQHKFYTLVEISEANLHERQFPGVTHILRKDGEAHVIQVIILDTIVNYIKAGHIVLAQQPE